MATAEEIAAETGRAAFPYQVHVGRWDELDGLVDAAYDRFGRVDVLVNNAGMSPLYDSLSSVTEKLFDAVMNLNLKGPFRLSALIGERMVADGGGSIINVSTQRLAASASVVPAVCRVQGRVERDDRRAREGLRSDGAGEHADARAVPDRYQHRVETSTPEAIRSGTSRCSVPANRVRSSAPHCS